MSESIEQLKIRTELKKADRKTKWKEKQAKRKVYYNYTYLPPDQKKMVDMIDCQDFVTLLEAKEYTSVCFVLGIIADLKMKGAPINKDQEQCLKFIQVLFDRMQDE